MCFSYIPSKVVLGNSYKGTGIRETLDSKSILELNQGDFLCLPINAGPVTKQRPIESRKMRVSKENNQTRADSVRISHRCLLASQSLRCLNA